MSLSADSPQHPEPAHAGPADDQCTDISGARARVFAVCSGKGGVGKTSLATNLSIAFARAGKRVCLFDADVSLANVNILLDLTPRRTLLDYMGGTVEMDDILLDAPASVRIVPGGGAVEDFVHLDTHQRERLLEGLQYLESRFDYLVVDTAAGIAESQLQLIQAAPFVVVAITEEPTSLTDAFSLLKVLAKRNFARPVLVVVNMATSSARAKAAFKRFRGATTLYLKLDVHYLGYVAYDAVVVDAVRQQSPFILSQPDALASRCVAAIARRLRRLEEVTGGSGGGVSAFFGSLHADEPGGEPRTHREDLLKRLGEHLSDLNEADAASLLSDVLALWPEQSHPMEAPTDSTPPAEGDHGAEIERRERAGLLAALTIAANTND